VKEQAKKDYVTPRLSIHGTVGELTLCVGNGAQDGLGGKNTPGDGCGPVGS
jgi:hypothetical protein